MPTHRYHITACLLQGNTKCLAMVYGAKEVAKRSEADDKHAVIKCEITIATFAGTERKRRTKADK